MKPALRLLAVTLASALTFAPLACDSSSKDKDEKEEKDDDDEGDDDDDDDDEGKKKKKKKKKKGRSLSGGDEDSDSKGATESRGAVHGPSAGAILDYMPADCPKGRAYLNTAALFSSTDSQKVLREISTKMLNKQRDAETQKAVEVLKKSGFDLATGIREAAMCMDATGDDPVMGFTLSVADPLGLLQDIAKSLGEAPPAVEKKGSGKMLTSDDVTFAQPADHVIVFGKKSQVEAVFAKKGGAGFASARGQVGYFFIPVQESSNMEGKITRAGANFNLWGALKLDPDTAKKAKEKAKDFEQGMRSKALESAGELKDSPFKLVYDRVNTATFQLKDDKIVATMSIPTTDITKLLEASAPELGVKLGGGSSGGNDAPVGEGGDALDELLKMMKKKK